MPVPARPLYQLHDPDLGQGAVPVHAVGRRRAASSLAAAGPDQACSFGRSFRRSGAVSNLHPLRYERRVPAPPDQRTDPAHLLDHDRLRAFPDGDAGDPAADRQIVSDLCRGDPDRLPARGVWRPAAGERCGSQRSLQQRAIRERPARRAVLQSRSTQVLRVGAVQRNLLLYALHVHLDGGEPVALETAGLCRPDRPWSVCDAGADTAADAVADAALHAFPGEPSAGPAGRGSLHGRRLRRRGCSPLPSSCLRSRYFPCGSKRSHRATIPVSSTGCADRPWPAWAS